MMKLVNSYYHWKIELIGYALGEMKMSQPQNVHFKKISPKVKNQNSKFLSTFYNFALKIENCWAERVVKSILETRNANIVVYVWFIHSWLKYVKHSMQKRIMSKKLQNLQQKTKVS